MAAQCATEVDDNPLWNFALAFYASKDVQQLLLTLQNEYQQDTLLVLAALWLAQQQQPWQLTRSQLDAYDHWRQHVIHSLRQARKAIDKHSPNEHQRALRQRLQQDEIRAEQLALHQLWKLHQPMQRHQHLPQHEHRHLCLQNLYEQAALEPLSETKKEALRPLFLSLADRL